MTELANIEIPKDVRDLCARMAEHGYRTWVVGGCLRDMLLGRDSADWDLATDARPEQVKGVFRKVIPTGIQHGTVTVRFRGEGYELTTLRGEGAYSDGRRPDSVHFVDDIESDLGRRDFTMNAIAYDPTDGSVSDPFGGLGDIRARVLRAVREPSERFGEDGLRVLRAARFVATLEVDLAPETEAAIKPSLETFRCVSAERVHDEWLKALRARQPSRAFEVMRRTGILAVTMPALDGLALDAGWRQSLRAVDLDGQPIERLAALLHPLTREEGWRAELDAWFEQYRFSKAHRAEAFRLLRSHTDPVTTVDGPASDAALRRLAARLERPHFEACLGFRARLAALESGDAGAQAQALLDRVRALVTDETALSSRELAVGGKDLIKDAGVRPGPGLGKLMEALLEHVLDSPEANERQQLLAFARDFEANTPS